MTLDASDCRDCAGDLEGKWVKGVSARQPLREVAFRVLTARMRTVWHWFPLAAEKSEEDVEYVHQLRIGTRRAAAAAQVFVDLIPRDCYDELREKLRNVRVAADAARNWDVLADRFSEVIDAPAKGIIGSFVERIRLRRRESQSPLVAIYRQLAEERFCERNLSVFEQMQFRTKHKAKREFGRQASGYLKPAVTRFFRASDSDLSSDEGIHRLRLRTKKLRYTMEIVAVAFEPGFRRKLYSQVGSLQNILGMSNDHATAIRLFREWLQGSAGPEEKAFLEGMLLAEERAHRDARHVFRTIWTPEAISSLRRTFRLYCGLP